MRMLRAILFLCFLASFGCVSAQDASPMKAPSDRIAPVAAVLIDLPTPDPKADEVNENAYQLAQDIIDYAKDYLGCKYRKGGKGPKTFDCSGFVGYVLRHFGFNMAASSKEQYKQGEKISNDEIKPGDLVFFGTRTTKNVGHVGLVVDVSEDTKAFKFIHASNSLGVTIDQYPDGGYYSKKYIGAKRLLEDL